MKTISLGVWLAACLALIARPARASTPGTKPENHYTGIVIAIDPGAHEFETAGAIRGKNFSFDSVCEFILPDGSRGTAGDLRAGENVTVTYRDASGVLVASRVEQHPMRFAGMIDDINPSNHTVTVYAHALDRTFAQASNCQVILRNHQRGTLTNLQKGVRVLVTYETPGANLQARRIELTSAWFTGTLTAVDLTARTLKTRTWFHSRDFKLADNCAVVIHGQPASLGDLKPDQKLSLKYDTITGVDLVNRIIPAAEATNEIEFDEYKVDF